MIMILCLVVNLVCFTEGNVNETMTSSSEQPLSLRNLCPYNKFCLSDPLKEIQDESLQPCCEDCSCDSDCFETGSCCPDMSLSGKVGSKYPCRHLWEFGKDVTDSKAGYHNDGWYHVIDGCPNVVENLSFQRCYLPTQLQDYVMVTETRTGRVYRNKHCAECNGIRNYEKLKLRIECTDAFSMTNLSTNEAREKYLMENCSLRTHLSENINGLSHCLPNSRVISTCNGTGSWDNYNKVIENGCLSNSSDRNTIFKHWRGGILSKYDYYANVYCFLCNINSQVHKVDTCKRSGETTGTKTGAIPFHVILDTGLFEEDTLLSGEMICQPTEIWDPFTMTCRQLVCPVGHIPYHGSCKGLFRNIEGYPLSINFEVLITNGNIFDDPVILRFFENRLMREMGNDISCGVCRVTLLYGKSDTSKFFFRYEIFATKSCPYDTLSERIRKIAIKKKINLKFKYKSQAVHAKLTLVYENIYRLTGFKALVEKVYAFCSLPQNVDESILLFCPAIMLPSAVVYEIGLNNALAHDNFKDSNATTQQVCVDVYFSFKQVHSGMTVCYCDTLCILPMPVVIFVNLLNGILC